jgi:hypothetical protein
MKFRILDRRNKYVVQRKVLLFFWMTITGGYSESDVEFDTQDKAELWLKEALERHAKISHPKKVIAVNTVPKPVLAQLAAPNEPADAWDSKVYRIRDLNQIMREIPASHVLDVISQPGHIWVKRKHCPQDTLMPARITAILGNYNPPAVKVEWDHGGSQTGPACNFVAAAKIKEMTFIEKFDPFAL